MPTQDLKSLSKRKVILVDANDNKIGETDLLDAHRGEGKLHRACSVYFFRKSPKNPEEIQLLIQQRSQEKIVGVGQWANTICGNLKPGENYEECAIRRLREELGIVGITKKNLKKIEKFQYQVRCNEEPHPLGIMSENEIDQAFAGWWDSSLKENPAEVRQTKWVSWKNVEQQENLAPWFKIMLQKEDLMKKLNEFILEK